MNPSDGGRNVRLDAKAKSAKDFEEEESLDSVEI